MDFFNNSCINFLRKFPVNSTRNSSRDPFRKQKIASAVELKFFEKFFQGFSKKILLAIPSWIPPKLLLEIIRAIPSELTSGTSPWIFFFKISVRDSFGNSSMVLFRNSLNDCFRNISWNISRDSSRKSYTDSIRNRGLDPEVPAGIVPEIASKTSSETLSEISPRLSFSILSGIIWGLGEIILIQWCLYNFSSDFSNSFLRNTVMDFFINVSRMFPWDSSESTPGIF